MAVDAPVAESGWATVGAWIEGYNTNLRHSACMMSPADYDRD